MGFLRNLPNMVINVAEISSRDVMSGGLITCCQVWQIVSQQIATINSQPTVYMALNFSIHPKMFYVSQL